MEQLNFEHKTEKLYRTVFTSTIAHEETAELIVPDAQPDILRFVETGATALMRSKEADPGQVRVTGMIDVCVTYLPDGGGGVRKLETGIPFTAQADSPEITPECLICARVLETAADARMINPRKILIRVNLSVEVLCCTAQELDIAARLDAAEAAAAQPLPGSCCIQALCAVTEKTFLISDDLSVPPLKAPGAELLRSRYTLGHAAYSVAGSRVVIRGEAAVELLYRPEGGGIAGFSYTVPYSQMIEFDAPCEDGAVDVWPMLTGAYLSPDGDEPGRYTLELHAVVQCACYTRRELSYVADVYSTRYALDCTEENYTLRSLEECGAVSTVIRGTVPASAPVSTVVSANVYLSQPVTDRSGGGQTAAVSAEVVLIYETEDGRILSAAQKLSGTTPLEGDADSVYVLSAAWNGECHTSVTASGVDVRIPVELTVRRFFLHRFTAVTGASYDPEKPLNWAGRPSVVLRRFAAGDSVWALAKKYGSTRQLICQANGLGEETEIRVGDMLLIPRRR